MPLRFGLACFTPQQADVQELEVSFPDAILQKELRGVVGSRWRQVTGRIGILFPRLQNTS